MDPLNTSAGQVGEIVVAAAAAILLATMVVNVPQIGVPIAALITIGLVLRAYGNIGAIESSFTHPGSVPSV